MSHCPANAPGFFVGNAMSAETIIDDLLRREGDEFTNDPDDRGGPTRFGITLETLRSVRNDDSLTADDVAALEEDEAREIYWSEYVDAPGFSKIGADELQELMVDSGVHSGPATATRWLQEAAGTTVDGDYGPLTDAAVKRSDPDLLYRDVLASRISHLGRLIEGDPSQAKYAHGWANRMAEFVRLTP